MSTACSFKGALSDAISLDTISISEPLGNIDFSIKVQIPFSDDIYYCQNGGDCVDGICENGKPCIATDNLPIALYLDDLIVYTDENDPAEDD